MACDFNAVVFKETPVPFFGSDKNLLNIRPQPRAENISVGLQGHSCEIAYLIGQNHVMNVDFFSEKVCNFVEFRCVFASDRDRRQRQSDAKPGIFAQPERR